MKTTAFLFSFLICGFVIYLAELPNKQVYDCRFVSFPIAVDMPQEVIHECQKRKLT